MKGFMQAIGVAILFIALFVFMVFYTFYALLFIGAVLLIVSIALSILFVGGAISDMISRKSNRS